MLEWAFLAQGIQIQNVLRYYDSQKEGRERKKEKKKGGKNMFTGQILLSHCVHQFPHLSKAILHSHKPLHVAGASCTLGRSVGE